jgi:MFS family permease
VKGLALTDGTARPRFFYGYVIAALCFLIQAVFWGSYRSFGLFFNPLVSEFGWTREEVAGAASVGFLIVGLMNLPSGAAVDRYGPRITLVAGGFCFGLGYLLMSGVQGLWQVYAFYAIMAVGMSVSDVVSLSTIARWFVKKRGTVTGLAKIGTGIGMLSMPLVTGYLIENQGWRSAYLFLGAFAMVTLIVMAQFMRRDPAAMRMQPYGGDARSPVVPGTEEGTSFHQALRLRPFWTLFFMYVLIVTCAEMVMVHTVPHAVDMGISPTAAAGILSSLGAGSIAARVIVGILLDRVGSRRALMLCFVPLITALVWLRFADSLLMLYGFAVLYGLSHGSFFTLQAPVVAQLFGTRAHGAIFGVIMAGGGVGGAIGPVLAGRAYDTLGSYQVPYFAIVGMALAALLLISSLSRTPYEQESQQGVVRG